MNRKAMVVLGLGAAAVLVAGASSASGGGGSAPKPPPPSEPKTSQSPAWQLYIQQALSTRDPKVIRAAADELERNGMATEAKTLRVAAAAIESANAAASAAKPPEAGKPADPDPIVYQTPGVVDQAQAAAKPAMASLPKPVADAVQDALDAASATAEQAQQTATGASTVPATPAPPVQAGPTVPADVIAAQRLAPHLQGTKKYQEDRAQVRAFQALVGLKQDGLYGANTAYAIADRGVLPPKPFYWPKKGTVAAKQKWSQEMFRRSVQDPKRAAEWQALAKV